MKTTWRETCNADDMGGATERCHRPVVIYLVMRDVPGTIVATDEAEEQVYWLCFTHWTSFINTMADNTTLVFQQWKEKASVERPN